MSLPLKDFQHIKMSLEDERQIAIEEIERRKGVQIAQVVRKIKPIYFFILFGILIFGFYLYNLKIFTGQQIFFYMLGATALIFISIMAKTKEDLLRESVIKKIVLDDIDYKQRVSGELSADSEFKLGPHCYLIWREEFGMPPIPIKWEVKVTEYQSDGITKVYTWLVHPIKGVIIGIKERPEGFYGTERGNTRIVMPPDYAKYFPPDIYEGWEGG